MIEMEPEKLAKRTLTLLLILNIVIIGYPSYIVLEKGRNKLIGYSKTAFFVNLVKTLTFLHINPNNIKNSLCFSWNQF